MRRELLDMLCCPSCKRQPLNLEVTHENQQEIYSGAVTCAICGFQGMIIDGVVELLAHADEQTYTERSERETRTFEKDFICNPLPRSLHAANIEQGLDRLTLQDAWVLDVGASVGRITRMICQQGAQAVAVDISTNVLRYSEAQFAAGVYFDRVAATMNNLPFRDRSFDVVFTSATMHHTPFLPQTFAEFSRLLKPGGYALLVNEPVTGLLIRKSRLQPVIQNLRQRGLNDQLYWLHDYLSAAHQAGFQTQFLFPMGVQQQLQGNLKLPASDDRASWITLRILQHTPYALRPWVFQQLQWLLGSLLVMVARKKAS